MSFHVFSFPQGKGKAHLSHRSDAEVPFLLLVLMASTAFSSLICRFGPEFSSVKGREKDSTLARLRELFELQESALCSSGHLSEGPWETPLAWDSVLTLCSLMSLSRYDLEGFFAVGLLSGDRCFLRYIEPEIAL